MWGTTLLGISVGMDFGARNHPDKASQFFLFFFFARCELEARLALSCSHLIISDVVTKNEIAVPWRALAKGGGEIGFERPHERNGQSISGRGEKQHPVPEHWPIRWMWLLILEKFKTIWPIGWMRSNMPSLLSIFDQSDGRQY